MKKWDVYVYGDVNIDEIIKEAKEIPPPGQEREVDTIKTCIGGGAALFAMGIGKLGLRTVFKGSVGNDLYGEYIKDTFKKLNIDTSLITTENGKNTGISLSFTDKKDRSFLTYRGTNDYIDIKNIKLDEVNIMQCYTPVELENYTENIEALIKELNMANLGKKPEGIKIMPEIVTVDMVLSDRIDRPGIGLDTDEIEVQSLELCGNIHMVVGKEGTGKTNVLKLILEQLKEAEVYICDSVGSELGREYKDMAKFYLNNEADSGIFYKLLEDEVNRRVSEYERVKNDKSLREFCMELTQVVIVIDDIERFINLCKDIRADLEKLIPKLLDYGISIVEAVTPNELRGFDELTKKLKDINSGVVLGIPDEQSFIRMPVIRNYKFVSGTGFVSKGGDIKKVRIPLI